MNHHLTDLLLTSISITQPNNNSKSTMSYKAGIFAAITALADRTPGSSSIAIKKHMQANLPADKKWMNTMYLNALKKAVADGELVQTKNSYKLSKAKKASKPKKKAVSNSIILSCMCLSTSAFLVLSSHLHLNTTCAGTQEEGCTQEEDRP